MWQQRRRLVGSCVAWTQVCLGALDRRDRVRPPSMRCSNAPWLSTSVPTCMRASRSSRARIILPMTALESLEDEIPAIFAEVRVSRGDSTLGWPRKVSSRKTIYRALRREHRGQLADPRPMLHCGACAWEPPSRLEFVSGQARQARRNRVLLNGPLSGPQACLGLALWEAWTCQSAA